MVVVGLFPSPPVLRKINVGDICSWVPRTLLLHLTTCYNESVTIRKNYAHLRIHLRRLQIPIRKNRHQSPAANRLSQLFQQKSHDSAFCFQFCDRRRLPKILLRLLRRRKLLRRRLRLPLILSPVRAAGAGSTWSPLLKRSCSLLPE